MSEPSLVVLVGNPNCGKTALFNALTGSRQKVANYAGVTVERKEGVHISPDGVRIHVVDLPGIYSLSPKSPDEMISREAVLGASKELGGVDAIVAVVDATHLERMLGIVLELKALNRPMILALNMMDLARQRGLDLDLELLEKELGCPVVPTVAPQGEGIGPLVHAIRALAQMPRKETSAPLATTAKSRFQEVDAIIRRVTRKSGSPEEATRKIDRVLLHPVGGLAILGAVLTLVFQAVFAWASPFQDAIENLFKAIGDKVTHLLSAGPFQDLLVNGVIAGVGSVLVFLPQILILFFFILIMEDTGYLARAAFLLDRLMGKVGLSGRSVIPLLSSYACAIPGIMATRTIAHRDERMVTLLVAPLTTCSARLPVYTLLISAFIPNLAVWGGLHLQGLVLLGLYLLGVVSPLVMAWIFRTWLFRTRTALMVLELPTYKLPLFKDLILGMWNRAKIFTRRAGTVILTLSIALWFLTSYPGHTILESYAGILGKWLEPLLSPLGFDWRIAVGLIPGMAAREVMVSALGTIYAVEGVGDAAQAQLGKVISSQWGLPTALSLLVWFVFAPQCLSTLAVIRRETQTYRWPAFVFGYMLLLAYGASWITYHVAVAWGV